MTTGGDDAATRSVLRGRGIAVGSLVGRVHFLDAQSWLTAARRSEGPLDAEEEIARLRTALERSDTELARLRQTILGRGRRHEAQIFAAHQQLLEDPVLLTAIERHIREDGLPAEAAVVHAVESIRHEFTSHAAPLVRDKVDDVLDVGHRLIRCLSPALVADSASDDPVVLVAATLEPSELVRFAHRRPCAAVVEACGLRSHVAILARALGVPLVAGIPPSALRSREGSLVRVDGGEGSVELAPDLAGATSRRSPVRVASGPVRTLDGVEISVALNLSDPAEAGAVVALGADGVGLFRSEFLYMDRETWPSEAELLDAFQEIARGVGDRPLAIRLADFGADKCPEYADFRAGRNPSLGLRGVRLLLHRRDVLLPQLRALAALARSRPVTLLIPMLDGLATLSRLEAELRGVSGGKLAVPRLRLGAMIEIPVAALGVRTLLPRVSSLAIGLNDLTQYVMAADREDEEMERYHDALDPIMLRLLRSIVTAAEAADRPVSVCGELAGDPALTSVLVSLGIRHFSVSRIDFDRIVGTLERLSIAELESERSAMLEKESSDEVRQFMQSSVAHPSL